MSIPNYLANIKSAGVYRYVFDKSMIPDSVDRTALRMLVGYSEKGPFNTPVYIESAQDFINTFGNISRRMERKGIFFHRLALQALQAGPILALNIKPFNQNSKYPEYASIYGFNASDIGDGYPKHRAVCKALVAAIDKGQRDVNLNAIYDTNRFWKVDADRLHSIQMLTPDSSSQWTEPAKPIHGSNDYIRIVQTSSADDSCTIFIRPTVPTGYNVKIADWYSSDTAEEMPPYMESIKDHFLSEFFAEVYVFKGDLRKKELFRHTGTLGSNLPIQYIYAKDENDKPMYWDLEGNYPVLEKVYAYNENGEPEYFIVSKYDDSAYKGAKEDYDNAVKAAKETYDAAEPAAQTAYDNAVKAAKETYDAADKSTEEAAAAAQTAYDNAVKAAKEDYDAVKTTYDNAVNTAGDDFKAVVTSSLWEVFTRANGGSPADKGWYEKNDKGGFVKSTDTVVDASKFYYLADPDKADTYYRSWIDFSHKYIDYKDELTKFSGSLACSVIKPGAVVELKADDALKCSICGQVKTYKEDDIVKVNATDLVIATTMDENYLSWQPFCFVEEVDGVTLTGGRGLVVYTNPQYRDSYGQITDALAAMADITTSNYISSYSGILFPDFRDANGNYVSLDVVFNADHMTHKMLMKFNPALLDEAADYDQDGSGVYGDSADEPGGLHTHSSDPTIGNSDTTWEAADEHFGSVSGFVHALTSAVHTVSGVSGQNAIIAEYDKAVAAKAQAEDDKTAADAAYNAAVAAEEIATYAYNTAVAANDDAKKTAAQNAQSAAQSAQSAAQSAQSAAQNAITAAEPKIAEAKANIKANLKPGVDETVIDDYDNADNKAAAAQVLRSYMNGTDNGEGAVYANYDEVAWTAAGSTIYGIYMEGYQYNSITKAERGRELVDKIYGVLQYKGIREALTNNVDVDYHYLVDTFQGYPGFAMKSQWAQIAKAKMNCLAIVNFPPMEDVMTHCGFSKYDGGFDMSAITKIANGITLPAETQGASWTAFYTQVVIGDGGSKVTIPSAAFVSNLFMEKQSKRLPYYIVAGPKYGRLTDSTVIGPDYNYARADLDVLEPFGVNAIVHIPRHGVVINSNQTAKQTPVSALSKVHIRELVTFLQDELEHMLRGYQWDLNTAALREKIRAKAEVILGLVLANGGIYDYRVKCDNDNNPPEVIDNEMVILDVEVEPARGAGRMIQTLTLHRTGGIAAMAIN